jgi:hypothetical protein
VIAERDGAANNEHVEDIDNVQIGDVVVDRAWFKDVENAFMTYKQNLEQRPTV